MKRIFYLILFVVILSGCAKLTYMKQLLLLKGLSDEQIELDAYVESQEENFNKLVDAINRGVFEEYKTKKQILNEFGDPIIKKNVVIDREEYEMWLYRQPMEYFNSKKVYVYFDAAGRVVDKKRIDVIF